MLFSYNFYSSFLLVFFVHTLVYAILFLVRYKNKSQQSSLWLGLFLAIAALYIAPWMLGFAGWYGSQPYRDILFYVPFQHLFLIGPFIFFYVSSLFNPKFRVKGKQWLHLLPASLYLVFCVVMVVYDKLVVNEYYFLKNGQDPDFDGWYQLAGFISMIIYFTASIRYYYVYKKAVEAVVSNAAEFLFAWVRNFLFAFLIILIAWFIVAVLDVAYGITFNISWWYFLGFALCCYYIAIAGYSNSVQARLFFTSSFLQPAKQVYLLKPQTVNRLGFSPDFYEEIALEKEAVQQDDGKDAYPGWKEKIEQLLEEDRLYENPELTLFDVASRAGTNISFLSKVINHVFKANFNDLVNSFRVKRFIALLHQGEHKKQTLLSLAFDCGFNSKTTFNRAFKKATGFNPQEYIKQNNF